MSRKSSSKVGRGIGFFFQVVVFVMGGYGLYLYAKSFQIILENRMKFFDGGAAPGCPLAAALASPFTDLHILLRFLFFIVAVGLVVWVLAYMNREIRKMNRTASTIVTAVSIYVFAGAAFLASLVFNIQWMVEVHLIGRVMMALGIIIMLTLIVGMGVKVKKGRVVLAICFALITFPAQVMIYLFIFQYIAPMWMMAIGSTALLIINFLVYNSTFKDQTQKQ